MGINFNDCRRVIVIMLLGLRLFLTKMRSRTRDSSDKFHAREYLYLEEGFFERMKLASWRGCDKTVSRRNSFEQQVGRRF